MMKFILAVLIIFLLSNVFSTKPDCRYSNLTGSFTFDEMNFKERNFDACRRKFEAFKIDHADTILYRLCKLDYWQFWNYGHYLFSPQYRLPYMDWREVEKRRGELANKSGFQDF